MTPDQIREEVARYIDAEAWMAVLDGRDALPDSMWKYRREWALRKADTILEFLGRVVTAETSGIR